MLRQVCAQTARLDFNRLLPVWFGSEKQGFGLRPRPAVAARCPASRQYRPLHSAWALRRQDHCIGCETDEFRVGEHRVAHIRVGISVKLQHGIVPTGYQWSFGQRTGATGIATFYLHCDNVEFFAGGVVPD